jgi:hypothetical protein
MQQTTTLLVEVSTDLTHLFNDDPIVGKYRALLGNIVYRLLMAPKRDRAALIDRKALIHRQIRGRKIQLLKASPGVTAPGTSSGGIGDSTLALLFPYINITNQ